MTQKKRTIVEIFTDGACSGNPGVGGYGAILRYRDKTKEISGYHSDTTNNRMEMMAVIEALKQIRKSCRITIMSDSNYVIKGMTEWLPSWIKKNWKNSQKRPVLNQDLWKKLITLTKPHQIEWKWIKGHKGHKENERCDNLARMAIRAYKEKQGKGGR